MHGVAEAAEGLLYEFAAADNEAAASWGPLRSCALRVWRVLDVMGRVLVLAALFSASPGGAATLVAAEAWSLLLVARAALGPLTTWSVSSFALLAGLPSSVDTELKSCIRCACRIVLLGFEIRSAQGQMCIEAIAD